MPRTVKDLDNGVVETIRQGAATGPTPRRNDTANRRHLTIADVCEDLDITRSTFYDWRQKRKAPPCFRLPNGELRIRRNDYEHWIVARMERAA